MCEAAFDRKAEEIVIMDMGKKSSFCEFFVVMSASSTVRVKSIVDHIEEVIENKGLRVKHKEGYHDALWVLLDLGEVIAHVFQEQTRRYYNLENLWGDVPRRKFLAGHATH